MRYLAGMAVALAVIVGLLVAWVNVNHDALDTTSDWSAEATSKCVDAAYKQWGRTSTGVLTEETQRLGTPVMVWYLVVGRNGSHRWTCTSRATADGVVAIVTGQ